MSQWSSGYVTDVEYTSGFYREIAPAHLNMVAVLNGCQPLDLDKPFTYCELGCGQGFSSHLLAASNPSGQFHAVDFNPAHIQGARMFAQETRLDNVTFHERSFQSLLENADDLPDFDFITFHGVYSWISPENRDYLTEFIFRKLKAGGVVYVSYNTLPGWAPMVPLQYLLYQYGKDLAESSSVNKLKSAVGFVERLQKSGVQYFVNNPSVSAYFENIKKADPAYLAHEYMNANWHPLYHNDVASEMSRAKLRYLGSADLLNAYPSLLFNVEQQQLLSEIKEPHLCESLKDFVMNNQFRRDVFVRGGRALDNRSLRELVSNFKFALLIKPANLQLTIQYGTAKITGQADYYKPFVEILNQGPCTLAELMTHAVFAEIDILDLLQIAVVLMSSGQVARIHTDQKVEVHNCNEHIAQWARRKDSYQALAAPRLGSGIYVPLVDRLFLDGRNTLGEQVTPAALAAHVWAVLQQNGQKMISNGETLESDQDNLAHLEGLAEQFINETVPRWLSLDVIASEPVNKQA